MATGDALVRQAQADAAGAVKNYREFFGISMKEWLASDSK